MAVIHDSGWLQEMEAQWKDVVIRNRPELCKMINSEGSFIDELESLKVFNNRTCQMLRSTTGRYNQVSAILTALLKRPFEDFVKFCRALERSEQEHVILECLTLNRPTAAAAAPAAAAAASAAAAAVAFQSIQTQPDARPAEAEAVADDPLRHSWRDLIRDNYPGLVSEIDPDHGLFDHLISRKVIVEWMKDTFVAKHGRSNRVAAILDHLNTKRPFEDFLKFCEALCETNQTHIVDKYLKLGCNQRGKDRSDCQAPSSPPQSELHRQASESLSAYNLSDLDWKAIFVETRSRLVEQIDASNEFINELFAERVFNEISYEDCVEKSEFVRAEFILDYMKRRPDEDFTKFCLALAKTNQHHVIKILTEHSVNKSSLSMEPQLNIMEYGDGDIMRHRGIVAHPEEDQTIHNLEHEPHRYVYRVQNEMQPGELRENLLLAQVQPPAEPFVPNRVTCQPEDDAETTRHQLMPNYVSPAYHHQEQISPDNDKGPVEIENVNVKNCSYDFFRMHQNDAYPIFKRVRGKCYIINVQRVQNMSTRNGTERDGQLISQLFKQLQFTVVHLFDPTSMKIKQTLNDISHDNTLRDDQCIVLFVLSHGQAVETPYGKADAIYGTDGGQVLVDEILEPLTDAKCPQLVNKPRLVFFQACRGDYYQTQTDAPQPPVYRDFIIGYPTQKDYRSFRHTIRGSWYINALIQVFMEKSCNTSLSEMLSLVAGKIGRWISETERQESNQKGQTATYQSHLTKSFYFFPGISHENNR